MKLFNIYVRDYCYQSETISPSWIATQRANSFASAKKKQLTAMKKAASTDPEIKIYANTYPFYSSPEEVMTV